MIGKWAVHALEPAFETVAQSKPLKLMFCIFSFFSDFKSIPFCFIIYCLSAWKWIAETLLFGEKTPIFGTTTMWSEFRSMQESQISNPKAMSLRTHA